MPKSNPALAAAMGQRMAARRKELHLGQEEVAAQAGITHQQYWKAERGKCCFNSDSLFRVCSVLHVSADYILFGEERQNRYQNILQILDCMTDQELKWVCEIMQRIVMLKESK
jgi:toxin-antitoxin system, antitoxin component, xre family